MEAPKFNLCRAAAFEVRKAGGAGDGFTMEGYAAVFGAATRIDSWEGRFDEVIEPGAFKRSISLRTPVLQFDHGHDVATGSVPIGAIEELREDDHGLFVRARLHDNARVEPIRQAIESGAIDGMSFRFRVTREQWDETGDVPLRSIQEVDLFELGPVVFPAYEATTVGVRSLLAGLSGDERSRLIAELRNEIAPDVAASGGASGATPDVAASGGASGSPIQNATDIRLAMQSAESGGQKG